MNSIRMWVYCLEVIIPPLKGIIVDIDTCMCVHVCVYLYACVYACVFLCVCIEWGPFQSYQIDMATIEILVDFFTLWWWKLHSQPLSG